MGMYDIVDIFDKWIHWCGDDETEWLPTGIDVVLYNEIKDIDIHGVFLETIEIKE
jgi:hypothetical protein